MLKDLRVVFTGVLVSFLGALPLSTTNVAAAQIAFTDGITEALWFSGGLVVADVFYIYLTLLAMQWIQRQRRLFKALEWLTVAIVFLLAASNFYAAYHPATEKNVVLNNALPRFWLGLLLNGLNPLQIPFWFGWTTVLFSKKLLEPRWIHYHLFMAGATVGFITDLLLFVFGGQLIAEKISHNQSVVYWVIGGIFLVTGVVQLWKMRRKEKDAVNQLERPKEMADVYEKLADEMIDEKRAK